MNAIMDDQIIVCPQCSAKIPLTKALTDPIVGKYKEELDREANKKSKELEVREKALKERGESIDSQVEEKLKLEKIKLRQSAEKEAREKVGVEVQNLKNHTTEMELKLKASQEKELKFLKEKRDLEEREKNFELEYQKKISEESAKIEEKAKKRSEEAHRLKDLEHEKKLQDALKTNEELKRKLEQGSQQTQGEVLELELEAILRAEFPFDEILPVEKGVRGADIIQKVHDRSGRECGTIIWESKRTKAWSDGWIQKLKDDQRAEKAEIAVIVSTVLPKEIKNARFKDGVWISNDESSLTLAHALRANLIDLARVRASAVGKNEKMEVVYGYLTGTQFKQRVEAIVEAFVTMQNDLAKEKRFFLKNWAKREKSLERVVENTCSMHGDLAELIGTSLPQIKMMELPEGESEE